ncbi:unnamed protein product [Rotaria sp. Silwood2]|nr:unnamed protein product [Rotaria sp. Silwood2]
MGYPYCPFVTWPFRKYITERRQENRHFGLRIHCGENVPFADNDTGAYRHFIAHMYIVFRCLRFLQGKLEYGVRVGHGIAFARILSGSMSPSTHRKSSVLLAEMREHAEHVLKNIVFEINITSNEYLLGQALREGDHHQTIRLEALAKRGIPIILSTDDDGIWPIDHCPSKHAGHHSLVAEYCRAFSLSVITSHEQLEKMLFNTNRFCFYSLDGVYIPAQNNNKYRVWSNEDSNASTIVFHPDVIKVVMQRYHFYNECSKKELIWNSSFYQHYKSLYPNKESCKLFNQELNWQLRCQAFAQIAYVVHNTNEDPNTLNHIGTEFKVIFGDYENHLHEIYKVWINVRKQFMRLDDVTDGQHVITNTTNVFLSESSDKQEYPLFSTLEFAKDFCNGYYLQVFTSEVSELHTSNNFSNSLQSLPPTTDISARVHTTKNKDHYIDSNTYKKVKLALSEKPVNYKKKHEHIDSENHKKIKLTFNETSTNRTNCSNVKEEHMLYVICRHASAATAYLHYIGNKFIEKLSSNMNDEKAPEQVQDVDQTGQQSA